MGFEFLCKKSLYLILINTFTHQTFGLKLPQFRAIVLILFSWFRNNWQKWHSLSENASLLKCTVLKIIKKNQFGGKFAGKKINPNVMTSQS